MLSAKWRNQEAAKMHEVKRAIIPVAGEGRRMRPLTLEIPKSLIPVNGTPMLKSIISGLHKNGIYEIYLVVGYLGDRFKAVAEEYPGITIIENPYYSSCNNISSLYMAREYLEDSIILDGDQLIYNTDVLSRFYECSGYNCVWNEEHTDEWLLTLKDGIIDSCSRTGGKGGWQLYSISRWTAEDGRKLRRHLELEFEKNRNRQIYWDDVVLFCHGGEYELGVFPMRRGDVIELDNLAELAALDDSYLKYLTKEAET